MAFEPYSEYDIAPYDTKVPAEIEEKDTREICSTIYNFITKENLIPLIDENNSDILEAKYKKDDGDNSSWPVFRITRKGENIYGIYTSKVGINRKNNIELILDEEKQRINIKESSFTKWHFKSPDTIRWVDGAVRSMEAAKQRGILEWKASNNNSN